MFKLFQVILVVLLVTISGVAQAQKNNMNPKRENFKLVLAVDGHSTFSQDVKHSPYLSESNTLKLYPSEKVFMEITQSNSTISSIKVVKENKNPDKTIEVSFNQIVENQKHKGMMLKISNPFDINLKYSSKIFLMKTKQLVDTDVLPIQAKLSSYETWPDIIVYIELDKWEFVKN